MASLPSCVVVVCDILSLILKERKWCARAVIPTLSRPVVYFCSLSEVYSAMPSVLLLGYGIVMETGPRKGYVELQLLRGVGC